MNSEETYEEDAIDEYEYAAEEYYEPGFLKNNWPIFAIVALAIVALALGIGLSMSGMLSQGKAVEETFVLEKSDHARSVTAKATASVPVAGEVTASANGTVSEVLVTVGQTVVAGDVIALLDGADVGLNAQAAQQARDEALAQRDAAQQAANAATEASKQAQAAYESAKTGYAQVVANAGKQAAKLPQNPKFLSDCAASVQSAKQSADAATAALQVAQARLDAAQKAADDSTAASEALVLKSPAAGVVTSLSVEPGATVDTQSGTALAMIGNYESATLVAALEVPAEEVGVGSLVTTKIDDTTHTLQVSEVKPTVRGCEIVISLSQNPGLVADGDKVDIEVELASHGDTYVIPASSLRVEGDTDTGYVQVIADDGTKHVAVVEIIEAGDGQTAVISSSELYEGCVLGTSYAN